MISRIANNFMRKIPKIAKNTYIHLIPQKSDTNLKMIGKAYGTFVLIGGLAGAIISKEEDVPVVKGTLQGAAAVAITPVLISFIAVEELREKIMDTRKKA